MDTRAGFMEVELANRHVVRQAHPVLTVEDLAGMPVDDFARVEFDSAAKTLTLTVPSGDELLVEVFETDDDMVARRAGRTVVYLDQNKWVTLARALHAPERLSNSERDAALTLVGLVAEDRVVVPLSSAHMLETGCTDGRWRRQMAPLMVGLSRGWILRDPLLVRHSELASMLARRAGTDFASPPVVTLDPAAFYSENVLSGPPSTPTGAPAAPAELARFGEILLAIVSIYAVLLDDEAVNSSEGDQATGNWAQWLAQAAQASVGTRMTQYQLRSFTLYLFLQDMINDIALAAAVIGAEESAIGDWIQNAEIDLEHAPYLGRLREVMHRRLSNPQERWETNDLVDMLYLPCATAHADVVVTEKKMGHFLRQVQRGRADGATVYSSLTEAVAAIDD